MIDLLKWILSPNSYLLATVPTLALLLWLSSLVISSPGWLRPKYFVSLGYGYSLAAMMFLTALVWDGPFWGRMTALILLVHGLRLGTWFWLREIRRSKSGGKDAGSMEVGGRIYLPRPVVWLGGSLAFVLLSSPVVFHLNAGPTADGGAVSVLGTWITLSGAFFAAAADFRKSYLEKGKINWFFSSVFFPMIRIPRYWSEIILWSGAWIGGVPFFQADPWRWILSTLGLALLILFSWEFSGAQSRNRSSPAA